MGVRYAFSETELFLENAYLTPISYMRSWRSSWKTGVGTARGGA